MRTWLDIALRAVVIAVLASGVGLGMNLVASSPIPYIYVQPKVIKIAGREIPIIDEKSSKKLLDSGGALFVDAREPDEFNDAHIPKAISLPESNKEEAFITVQPLLPEEMKIIVYCSGPECDSAEKVAGFLSQLGYKDLSVMASGTAGWKAARYPME